MSLFLLRLVGLAKIIVNTSMFTSVMKEFGEGQKVPPLKKRQKVISFQGRASPDRGAGTGPWW